MAVLVKRKDQEKLADYTAEPACSNNKNNSHAVASPKIDSFSSTLITIKKPKPKQPVIAPRLPPATNRFDVSTKVYTSTWTLCEIRELRSTNTGYQYKLVVKLSEDDQGTPFARGEWQTEKTLYLVG